MAVLPTGIGPVTGYQIERSLRFNSADSAYLNRTPASAGNRKTWTWSGWVKANNVTTNQVLFDAYSSSTSFSLIRFSDPSGSLRVYDVSSNITQFNYESTSLYRDFSAWYHIVVAVDTTQATAGNRVKIYVNGVQITAFSASTNPSQNYDGFVNNTIAHDIGRLGQGNSYLNGYMTEINFIDGQALTPSSFGQTNASTGVWEPINYTGTYGTNGFFLKFADNSNTTAATLGKDSSGNGNNWTPNNFSVTAGAGNDSLVDSPTSYGTDTGVGGEVRGNYATWNPLATSGGTFSNGNLQYTGPTGWRTIFSTIQIPSTESWYVEATLLADALSNSSADTYAAFGLAPTSLSSTSTPSSTGGLWISDAGWVYNNTASPTNTGSKFLSGQVIGLAFNSSTGAYTFYKNNVSIATGTFLLAGPLNFIYISYSAAYGQMAVNFGQRPFAYTAPSGFKALCTQNLPTPTIGATSTTQANDYFNAVLYTGNNSTQSISGVGFQPDWVWIKERDAVEDHFLFDSVRGATKYIRSNTTDAEGTLANYLTSFDSDGFSLGNGGGVNGASDLYVAWNWKANGAGSSNTAGSITSTVSANTTAGFSVVTYTGTGSTGTVGHGLGVAPSMIIVKRRSTTGNWPVYHISVGNNQGCFLNLTNAVNSQPNLWNSTTPSSTVFTVGTDTETNQSTQTLVAYCFAPVAGYSAFGSYTGNGAADGPFVYTGFRPRYFMAKRTDAAGNSWILLDTARNTYNAVDAFLSADLSNAEATSYPVDFVSNGFKIRATTSNLNTNGGTYIYAAFAESPFKYSLAR